MPAAKTHLILRSKRERPRLHAIFARNTAVKPQQQEEGEAKKILISCVTGEMRVQFFVLSFQMHS